jgi:hypothetical protein
MPNTELAVRRRSAAAPDPHGEPMPGLYGAATAFLPGLMREETDGSWLLCLDDSLWPVRLGDLVVSSGGRSWLVASSHLAQNSLDSSVNYVRCTGAQQHPYGTEPGGPEYVGV